ncbi:DTW domain-containing protein [Arenibaculum pallidiluteum]|uniref:DTW domain-containing protein n=1 Tax=Arenibaculum pallidiluteum TaxID=2812559 RepID=UPI001A965507|nr:tRNA-uridine aminocarboxypropyltransferase [Arenibaculum pallidiluteum]
MHPDTCPTCGKPGDICVCGAVSPTPNRVFLLILQHPQEKVELLGTAPISRLQFPNSMVRVGLSWPNLKRILGRDVDYKRWGVLYLGPARTGEGSRAEIAAVDKAGNPLPDSEARLAALEGLIVLDGTWSQAKTLWWRNAWLLKCQRVVLHPRFRSLYGKARREPRRESVSTLESAAFALSRLEGQPAMLDRALETFSLLLDRLKAARRPPGEHVQDVTPGAGAPD